MLEWMPPEGSGLREARFRSSPKPSALEAMTKAEAEHRARGPDELVIGAALCKRGHRRRRNERGAFREIETTSAALFPRRRS